MYLSGLRNEIKELFLNFVIHTSKEMKLQRKINNIVLDYEV